MRTRCNTVFADNPQMTCSRPAGHSEAHFYQTDEARENDTGGTGVVRDSEYYPLYIQKARQLAGLIVNDDAASTEHVARLLQREDATEIEGRFFSPGEARELIRAIDDRTIRDPQLRAAAAKCWETDAAGPASKENDHG
jgi:hypothetical protein